MLTSWRYDSIGVLTGWKKFNLIVKRNNKKEFAFLINQNLFEFFTSPGNIWITQAKACPKEIRRIETINSILILLLFEIHNTFPCSCAYITIQANNTEMRSLIWYSLQLLIYKKEKNESTVEVHSLVGNCNLEENTTYLYSFNCLNQCSVLQQSSVIHIRL